MSSAVEVISIVTLLSFAGGVSNPVNLYDYFESVASFVPI